MRRRIPSTLALATAVLAAGACSDYTDPTAPDDVTALLSIQPASSSVGVSVGTTVVVTFDHATAVGMEAYAALHEGSVAGAEVGGAWSRSADGTGLTFTPDAPLKPATTYVVHLGGGMMDENGHTVDLSMHGEQHMGGQWASGSMLGGGMGSGGMGSHMGTGWQHPTNGSYGMIFTFTTAAS